MNRIKVINEPSELVTMLRALDTEIKRDVFREVTTDWRTAQDIEEKFGEEGKKALTFFEKMRLVETKWQSNADSKAPEKAYHTYYMSFHINTSCPITEISDVLSAAVMQDKEFKKIEKKILKGVGDDGKFVGDVAEDLKVTPTFLKSLVKRSVKLEYRGHRIEATKD